MDQSIAKRLKLFRILVTVAASAGLLALATGAVIPVLWPDSAPSHLISAPADAVISELLLQIGGAILSTALIGWFFERLANLESAQKEELEKLAQEEGISGVLKSHKDVEFEKILLESIDACEHELVFIGLGHSYFYGNDKLINAVRNRIIQQKKLKVYILFADSANAGLKQRVQEEATASAKLKLHYDLNWPNLFFDYVNTFLTQGLAAEEQARVFVRKLSFFPMLAVIRTDDFFLHHGYGVPHQRGGASPWIVLNAKSKKSALVSFLDELCDTSVKDALST